MASENDNVKEDRRSFLKKISSGCVITILSGAGSVVGAAITKPFMGSIDAKIDYFVHEELGLVTELSSESKYMAKKLLFGTGEQVSIIPSENNPNAPHGGITEPTRYIGDRLVGVLSDAQNLFKSAAEIRVRDLSGNILCLGGPIANEISREVMGLNGKSRLIHEHIDGLHLKFPCTLDHKLSTDEVAAGKFRNGKNGPIPVWHFKTPGGILVPEVRNGRLITDYLHIISLPHIFSEEAKERRRRITIVFGSHGPGTRALAILIEREQRLMADILDETNKMKAWHAILLVDQVSADGEKPLSLGAVPIIHEIKGKFGRIAEILTKEAMLVDRG